jgi:RNA polymerase sigma-70 factor (ECF subfamily)
MNETHNSSGTEQAGKSWFQATRWSLILAIGQGDTVQAAPAREELCRTYWHAIYGVIRKRGYSVEDAQDFTQEFLVCLLEKNAFKGLNPKIGKFRHFLLTALRNFLNNKYDRSIAQKRYPGKPLVSLNDAENRYQAISAVNHTEDMIFDRQWALAIVDRAMVRLRESRLSKGGGDLFESLRKFLSCEPTAGEYDALADKFKMQNKAVAMTVSRLRRAYRDLIIDEIRQTVEDENEVEAELRYLLEVLHR